ncbi:hypothetical protein CHS0354_031953 [Potamilus streckersoni]|uniref:FAS1 domain-containing protein n=1 Tax=Potamilus streckersoni TaxID=2493646 RepID=A0AAE0S3B3_9BIVA|nr:hypothetical protein CHS0354_031953 [Potamilus streckersoni]
MASKCSAAFLLGLFFVVLMEESNKADTIMNQLQRENHCRQFKEKIEAYNLVRYVEQEDITVFAPTSDSFLVYDSSLYGYDMEDPDTVRSVMLYHIVRGRVRCTDSPTTLILEAIFPNRTKLYLSQFSKLGKRICTVNGVRVTATNTEASNGILHIVDRVISPIQSQKTIAEFLTQPDIPKLTFQSIYLASVVDMELRNDVNSSSSIHTIFAPLDVYVNNMPDYGQGPLFQDTGLLKLVFWAHVVENKAFYIPDIGDIPQVNAKAGNLSFTRYNGQVYVYNNGVRARILMANIPLVNGVVHVLDNLLFYKYRSITQMVGILPETSISAANLNQTNTQIKTVLRTATKLTMFVPMDEAYAKLPFRQQEILIQNVTRLSEVFGSHIVQAVIDSDGLYDGATYYTIYGDELKILRRTNDIYIEGGGVLAKILIQNIGCTNGVIHAISNVLFVCNFTVWEAIQGLDMLSKMKEFLNQYTDIQQILSYEAFGPITVFLTGNTALSMIAPDTLQNLEMNSNGLFDRAVRGGIAKNVKLGTSLIYGSIEVGTYSGQKLNITKRETGLVVTGTFIEASVIVRDIWCSNGVLHIVDNLLHVPTRNIVEEMAKSIELSIASSLLDALPEVLEILKSTVTDITIFVPSNEAFTDLTTESADVLMKNISLLITILKGHIVSGSAKLMDEFTDFESMQALSGKVYVIKKSGGVFVSNNNVMGRLITGNMRCTNGVIHIIDRLLYFPYKTVEVTMQETPWLSKFYGLMSNVVEFVTLAGREAIQQTLFAPSDNFLANVPSILQTIKRRPDILMETFRSHYFPDVNLGSKLLKDINLLDNYRVTSTYNVTFTIRRNPESIIKEDVVVDVGYPNLKQNMSLVISGVACSNGIIYVIQGLLNYPMNTLLAEIYREKNLRIAMDQLLKLAPENRSIDLNSSDDIFTVFAPVDQALQFLSFKDICYLKNNVSAEMMNSIIGRHFIHGAKYTLQYITDGGIDSYFSLHNMTVLKNTSGVFLVWQNIEAKVFRSNILASNGIIHVIDKILFSTPYATTSVTATTQKGNIGHISSTFYVSYSFTSIALLLLFGQVLKTL